jgi:hypothetical protein
MSRKLYFEMLTTFFILVSFTIPLFALAEEDPCWKEGIVVKNLSMTDRWYKKNKGNCTIWQRNHIFVIKPKDTVEIFSDLVCKTPYCAGIRTYSDYKSIDINNNCRVKILSGCNISDM